MTGQAILQYARSVRITAALYDPLIRNWYCRVKEVPEGLLTESMQMLSEEEQHRYSMLRLEADRDAYLIAHILLRVALSECTGVAPASFVFRRNTFGRPELSSEDEELTGSGQLRFSLSHSRGTAFCAITPHGDIGVDVEEPQAIQDADSLIHSVLTRQERAEVFQLPQSAHASTLLAYWTLKEAYLKATGVGLSREASELSFSGLNADRIRLHLPHLPSVNTKSWRFDTFLLEGGSQAAMAFRPNAAIGDLLPRRKGTPE